MCNQVHMYVNPYNTAGQQRLACMSIYINTRVAACMSLCYRMAAFKRDFSCNTSVRWLTGGCCSTADTRRIHFVSVDVISFLHNGRIAIDVVTTLLSECCMFM